MQPPQPPPQQFQSNSSMSMDHDKILETLTSLMQSLQNQAKEMSELKNQFGEIEEFMGQMQEQSELSNSTIVNPKGGFETANTITLRSGKEIGTSSKTSKPSKEEDEKLLQQEERATARVEHPCRSPLRPLCRPTQVR